jgi:hypothetical protein
MQRYYYAYELLDGSKGLYFVDAASPAQALSVASYHINSIAGLKTWRHHDVSH